MIAAIYARKSTEQKGHDDEEKSVTRQIQHAKSYAERNGWSVAEEHIYVDDGISGAEFVKRPGFLSLMNALTPRPAFQLLVMSEESRLGREQIETAYALKQIMDAGVRVFFYLENRERTLDSAIDKITLSVTTFAAEVERERARQRTYDAMRMKAMALHVTGGKIYGYDNVEVLSPVVPPNGSPTRLHVVRQINERQAEVIKRIFEMYVVGLGITRIAKALNADHIPSPWHERRRGGWAPTAIREILHRELYRGTVVWNKHQKIIRAGTKKRRQRPVSEWLRFDAPHLRVVSEELWASVQARLKRQASAFVRTASGQLVGKPSSLDGHSPYLLTGFATCTICTGAIGGVTQLHGTGPSANRRRVTFYACTWHRKRGTDICPNEVVVRQDLVDHVLLGAIQEILDERALDAAVDRAFTQLRAEPTVARGRRAEIQRDLALTEQRIQRGLDALLNGIGPGEELQARLKEEKTRKMALADELDLLARVVAVPSLDAVRLRRDLKERVRDVRALLGRHPTQARQALRQLLVGKIDMEPIAETSRRGYRLSGALNYGGLIQGEALQRLEATGTGGNSRTVVSPTHPARSREALGEPLLIVGRIPRS